MDKYTAGIIIGLLGAGLSLQTASGQPSQPVRGHPQMMEQAVPFSYEYDLHGPATIESDTLKTAGTIKTISAYYEFDGQVILEVSANGGTSYAKIINGTILKDGFIPGNELRYRTTVTKDSVLKKIIIGYTDSSGASTLYQNPDLKNYKYRKAIYISGGSEEVFNYPLKIDGLSIQPVRGHSASGLNETPSSRVSPQIYFTSADAQTPLYYYVENEIASSPQPAASAAKQAPRNDVIASEVKQSRTFWVKVPQIPKEGTMIYVYYDKQGLSPQPVRGHSASGLNETPSSRVSPQMMNPEKAFPFFEDFSGNNLDETKWEAQSGVKKEYTVKDGYLELKDGLIITRNFKMKQGILEFKAKAEESASIQAIVRNKKTPRSLFPLEQIVYSSNYPGAEHTIAINDMAKLNIGKPIQSRTYYIYKVTLNQTGIIFERYSENYQKQAEIKFLDMGNSGEGYIGLKADAAPFNAGSVYFDWLRVRPYIEVEPLAAQEY